MSHVVDTTQSDLHLGPSKLWWIVTDNSQETALVISAYSQSYLVIREGA